MSSDPPAIEIQGLARRFGKTEAVLGLDLTAYPISRRWLRFWLMSYLVPHNFQGLQLLVPDWMALSRDIEGQRTAWKTRQRESKRDKPLTSLIGHHR